MFLHPASIRFKASHFPRLVSGILLILFTFLLPAESHGETHFECGRNFVLQKNMGDLPAEGLQVRDASMAKVTTTITLNAGAGLTARPQALAAWQSAVAIWESILLDPVSITIDGDFISLPAGVLGSTGSRSFLAPYNTIRNEMVADRDADEGILTQLPSAAQLSTILPTGFTFNGNMVATKANLKALGFDMSFDAANADASMNFSTGFASQFDYDPSDGISAGKIDFEAVVVHEIGHALGFTSAVDAVDYYLDQATPTAVEINVLDAFRMMAGQGAVNFTSATRILQTGQDQPVQMFYDGSQDLGLSTGSATGDGRQASHWKADELSGVFIGIMDPTLANGDREEVQANDIRAFGLLGWDVINGAITDCNSNGISDIVDISAGTSLDCNSNGIPDECDIADGTSLDCNNNGVPDDCDISAGTSQDFNNNSIPDECDPDCNSNGLPDDLDISLGVKQDCNNNSVPDDCDIAAGTSQDCNSNGIPDECESDCNGNGVPDDCDISAGTSQDCNANTVPDECDIAAGTSQDCNSNGIPDECESDCNGNGVPDDCDISAGTSQDCNANTVPDECDIAAGTSQDCNSNGIPDECESDCNGNGVPDDCDISAGTSQDCNANNVPDECDIAAGSSQDLNGNSIPDECEGDCNNNSVPDDFDISSGTSSDFNGNGIPDECEADCNNNSLPDDLDISGGLSLDCNANTVPDECDISAGTSQDCNSNGIPDECEGDCNSNGIPDDCDISSGFSQDLDGNEIPDECSPTDVGGQPRLPRETSLQASPNPFNPRTVVMLALPVDGQTTVEIFNAAGRLVKTLASEYLDAGWHEFVWDGNSDSGQRVSSGVYFAVARGPQGPVTAKLSLIK